MNRAFCAHIGYLWRTLDRIFSHVTISPGRLFGQIGGDVRGFLNFRGDILIIVGGLIKLLSGLIIWKVIKAGNSAWERCSSSQSRVLSQAELLSILYTQQTNFKVTIVVLSANRHNFALILSKKIPYP